MDWYQRIFIGLESTGQLFILFFLLFLPGWSGAYRFALVHIAQGSYPFFSNIFFYNFIRITFKKNNSSLEVAFGSYLKKNDKNTGNICLKIEPDE